MFEDGRPSAAPKLVSKKDEADAICIEEAECKGSGNSEAECRGGGNSEECRGGATPMSLEEFSCMQGQRSSVESYTS